MTLTQTNRISRIFVKEPNAFDLSRLMGTRESRILKIMEKIASINL